jgi:hypothetical protein
LARNEHLQCQGAGDGNWKLVHQSICPFHSYQKMSATINYVGERKIPGLTKLLKKQGCLHPNILWAIWLCKIHHHWNLQITFKYQLSIPQSQQSMKVMNCSGILVLQGQQGKHFPGSLYYLLQCC